MSKKQTETSQAESRHKRYSSSEVAKKLGCSRWTVARLYKNGKIRAAIDEFGDLKFSDEGIELYNQTHFKETFHTVEP